jgi:hypothetical protein
MSARIIGLIDSPIEWLTTVMEVAVLHICVSVIDEIGARHMRAAQTDFGV